MFKPTDRQTVLFGADAHLQAAGRRRLQGSWAEGFRRRVVPILLEAESGFADLYETSGRGCWSVARKLGLCILQEMSGHDDQAALDCLTFDVRWQHALGLSLDDAYLSRRSFVDFRSRLVRADPEMLRLRVLFDRITDTAVEELSIQLGEQRLDSTHIRSNIAARGRCGLIADSLRCLLRIMERGAQVCFASLSHEVRSWYAGERPIVERGPDRYAARLAALGGWLAEMLCAARTAPKIAASESYAVALCAFEQHYVIDPDGKGGEGDRARPSSPVGQTGPIGSGSNSAHGVVARRKPIGGKNSLQSAHDPDATYGHKGGGYHVQVAETCSNAGTEIITDFLLTEAIPDQDQALPTIVRLQQCGRQPDVLFADAGYGSGKSLTRCAELGVALFAPVSPGRSLPRTLRRNLFDFDSDGLVAACPEGHAPVRHGYRRSASARQGTALHAYFDAATCRACPRRPDCSTGPPSNGRSGCYQIEIRPEQVARDLRLAEQKGEPFRTRIRIRAGIEATNSELKRAHGLGVLRVRRRPRVRAKVAFKVIACNTKRWLRAARFNRI